MALLINLRRVFRRMGLKNKDFTIISNNCWGGSEYEYFGLKYRTPFVGLFLREDDYVRLLQRFQELMSLPLVFRPLSESKYPDLIYGAYPLAILGEDIEIHFMHYKSEEEARTKWERRKERINYDNILFKLSERTAYCSPEVMKTYLTIPLKNRILFTQRIDISKAFSNALYLPELSKITSGNENVIIRKAVNTRRLLNGLKK